MSTDDGRPAWKDRLSTAVPTPTLTARWRGRLVVWLGVLALAVPLAVDPVLAQQGGEIGQQFCETRMVQTTLNMINVVRLAGPLLGGFVAITAVVSIPVVRRSDLKKELKSIRNQGVLWGVVVAPLGTTILQFILNDVVVGASACGF